MHPIYTEKEFRDARSRDLLPLVCASCGLVFKRCKNEIQKCLSGTNKTTLDFCGTECRKISQKSSVKVACSWCGTITEKQRNVISKSKSKRFFCCQSCAAKYANAHKKHGTRVSKLEKWLQSKLQEFYPDLEFRFNRTDAINSELDIYIPSLRLAFEMNGIFHYEPIYGSDQFSKIQTNDHRKMLSCAENGISLCVIDVSSQKKFTEASSLTFLEITRKIIESRVRLSRD